MKGIAAFLAVAALAVAEGAVLKGTEDQWPYHEKVGIPAMERIMHQEQARDFDGSRIIGGGLVDVGTHPYLGGVVVHLQSVDSMCGAALLTNTRALTAAHCWNDGRNVARGFTMVYGSFTWSSGGVRVPSQEVIVHQNWNPRTLENDIAMVRHEWVSFTNNIRAVKLPSGSDLDRDFEGIFAVASGYGRSEFFVSGQKRAVTLTVISNLNCKAFWGDRVVDSMMCARGQGPQGPSGVCDGDFGGPLVIGNGIDRVLIGISSFATISCQPGDVYGFTRVNSFIPWIVTRL